MNKYATIKIYMKYENKLQLQDYAVTHLIGKLMQ